MLFGGLLGAICFSLGFFKDKIAAKETIAASPVLNFIYNTCLADFMLASSGLFCICVTVQVVASLVLREPLKAGAETLVWENWTAPLRMKCGSGLADYRFMSALVLVIFGTLYFIFH
jgi:hypothetical protein